MQVECLYGIGDFFLEGFNRHTNHVTATAGEMKENPSAVGFPVSQRQHPGI
jgi:hypothetical protein